MYRLLVFLLLLMGITPLVKAETVVTQAPFYNKYYAPQAYWGGDYIPSQARYRAGRKTGSMFSDINDLERYAMNKNFLRDSDRTRLERLEMQAFGAVQQGNMQTRYNNVREAILTRPQQNYRKSFLRSVGDYLSGQLTGYTPSTEDSFFGNSSDIEYNSPFRKGYRTNNYGISSGSGVHILD